MGPVQAVTTCLRKSFQFSGRASRSEFWPMASLTVVGFVLANHASEIGSLWFLIACFFPYTAGKWRRLHDRDLVGLWVIPPYLFFALGVGVGLINSQIAYRGVEYAGLGAFLAGTIAFLVAEVAVLLFCMRPSTPGPNRFGPNPLEVTP